MKAMKPMQKGVPVRVGRSKEGPVFYIDSPPIHGICLGAKAGYMGVPGCVLVAGRAAGQAAGRPGSRAAGRPAGWVGGWLVGWWSGVVGQ